jgi:translocation and assembly module TamA
MSWLCCRAAGLVLALALTALTGCASSDDKDGFASAFKSMGGVAYTVTTTGAPSEDMQQTLERALRLYTLQERLPSSSALLRRRAESDVKTTAKVLRSEGYYASAVEFSLDETETPAVVTLQIKPGARFRIGQFNLDAGVLDGVTLPQPAYFGLAGEMPARASDIVTVEAAAVRWLKDHGFAQAKFAQRKATADNVAHTLDIVSEIVAGPRSRLGELRVSGLDTVREDYVRSYQTWTGADWYSQTQVNQMVEQLSATGLFEFTRARAGATQAGATPVEVSVKEGKYRSIGGGLRVSTDDGPVANAFLEHRNLFGANETGRLFANAALFDQELGVTFRKPQFLRPRQALLGGASVHRQRDDAFDELAARARVDVERTISSRLRVAAGVFFEAADVSGSNRNGTSLLLGVPLSARYDTSDSALDPSTGFRVRADLTPYVGAFDGEALAFPVLDVQGSVYWPIGAHVLAVRARLGSIIGAARDDVPPTQRLYAGGGGSVRGYKSRSVGPLDFEDEPLGGRSVAELGFEVRVRVTPTIGIVPFVEAGTVAESSVPNFGDELRFAAGLGARYFSVIGPLRADLGVPLNRRDSDDLFQVYVSIGQAF